MKLVVLSGIKSEILSIAIIILSFIGMACRDSIPYSFITAPFMHGNFQHFSGNIMIFLMLSPAVEKHYGRINYICAFLYCAIVDYLFQTYVFNVIAIGLSGFVFALFMLNAFITKKGGISVCGIVLLFIYGSKEISGLFNNDGISHSGHLIGLAAGLSYAMLYNCFKRKEL